MSSDCGFVYVATGEKFISETKISAGQIRRVMPDVSIALITDETVESDCFNEVIQVSDLAGDFGDRVAYVSETPYDRTIFIDSDIYVNHDISDVFEVLNDFDVALVQDDNLDFGSTRVDNDRIEALPDCFPEYNGGFIAFRQSAATREFIRRWKEIFAETRAAGCKYNQPSLRAALYESEVRIATLPPNYNYVTRRPGCVKGKVKVLHGRLCALESPGAETMQDIPGIANRVDEDEDLRLYYPVGDTLKRMEPNVLTKVWFSLRSRGIRETISLGKQSIFGRDSL